MNKKILNLAPFLLIIFLSLLPFIYTYGRLAIGGDVMIPLTSSSLQKYLFHWIGVDNGMYFAINYYPYYIMALLFEKLNLGFYMFSGLLLLLLNLVAGVGVHRLCLLMFPTTKKYLYVIPLYFYLLSPALLNAPHYLFSYSFLPWIMYPFFKFYLTKKVTLFDILTLSVAVFFASMELPNPKYIFHFHLIALLIVLYGLMVRKISLKDIWHHLGKFLIYILLISYIWAPQVYFAFNYSSEKYNVKVKSGASESKLANYGIDTADKVLNLHQDHVFLNSEDASSYTKSKTIKTSFFILPLLVFFTFFAHLSKKRQSKSQLGLLHLLTVVYIFFSLGPNPPFGFIYDFIVTKISLLAFLRTTAGAVFYLSLFYALIVCFYFVSTKKFRTLSITLFLIFVTIYSWPLLNGHYYRNFNDINQYTNTNENGITIPSEYLELVDIIDSKKIDAKTLYPNSSLTYLNTSWGFFGPVIYNFLYSSTNIGMSSVVSEPKFHNVGFVINDKSLLEEHNFKYIYPENKIYSNNIVDYYELPKNQYLPHIYIPKLQESATSTATYNLSEFNEVISFNNSLKLKPTIEYKKINPTKYRLLLHSVPDNVPLIFSEKFDKLWGIYIGKVINNQKELDLKQLVQAQSEFQGNGSDQSTKQELGEFVTNNQVTYLGEGKSKLQFRSSWTGSKRVKQASEKYIVDFVSKNFSGTIQNDNLQKIGFVGRVLNFEDFIHSKHNVSNEYSNSWLLDIKKECASRSDFCKTNRDGSYDLELLIEFKPQRLYEYTIILSAVTFVIIIIAKFFSLLQKRNHEAN